MNFGNDNSTVGNVQEVAYAIVTSKPNTQQYEALKDKGMSKERAAKIANSPRALSRGGKKSGSGSNPTQGGTSAQKRAVKGGSGRGQEMSALGTLPDARELSG